MKTMIPIMNNNTRGGSMRITIFTWAIILTKAYRAMGSIETKGCIVA